MDKAHTVDRKTPLAFNKLLKAAQNPRREIEL